MPDQPTQPNRSVRLSKKKLKFALAERGERKTTIAYEMQLARPDIYPGNPPTKVISRALAGNKILYDRAEILAGVLGCEVASLLHESEKDAVPWQGITRANADKGESEASADQAKATSNGDAAPRNNILVPWALSVLCAGVILVVGLWALFDHLQSNDSTGTDSLFGSTQRHHISTLITDDLPLEVRAEIERLLNGKTTEQLRFVGAIDAQPIEDLRDAAKQLGSKRVLAIESSKSGRFTELFVTLATSSTTNLLWMEAIPTAELGQMVQPFTNNIVATLEGTLNVPGIDSAVPTGTTNRDAFDNFRKARQELERASGGSIPELKSAFRNIQSAIDQDSRFAMAHAMKCEILTRLYWADKALSNLDDAQLACSTAGRLVPDHPYIHAVNALREVKASRYDEALKITQAVMPRFHRNVALRLVAAEALFSRYDQEGYPTAEQDGMDMLQSAIELEPEYWAPYFWLGTFALYTDETDRARKNLQHAAKLNPNEIVLSNLGYLLLCQNDLDGAEAAYTNLANEYPTSHLGPEMLASVHHYKKQFKKAIVLRNEGLDLLGKSNKPQVYQMYGSLGDAHRLIGQQLEAKQQYQKALDVIGNDDRKDALGASDFAARAYYYARIAEIDGKLGDEARRQRITDAISKAHDDGLYVASRALRAQAHDLLGESDAGEIFWRKASAGCPVIELHPDRPAVD